MIDETAGEIADMQTHSSSVVAVKAARALLELTDQEFPAVEEYLRALERNSNALRRANPSHASLHNTQGDIVDTVTGANPETVGEAQELTERAVEDVVETVETGKRRAAEQGAVVVADDDVLLTHDYSTTVLSAVRRAVAAGAEFTVYVTEARPRYLGRKMARRLAEFEAVDTHHLVDSASGHYMAACDRVFVGMDCIVGDTLYNRVGTYTVATAAADVDVPFTAVGSATKLVDDGFAFENEHRVASEVMREPAEGFTVENPSYDATPLRLVDGVVTGDGHLDPSDL